ncbi:DNA internalization-related competence protein ComEC/Rec2 [Levilactobacillus suantsaiihabitans]|uniref:DNA internalization-related competence protein ComEC/Rec2 n=1 Tax=Levilactobacillus suantsaiihabitans TaxID=2487722 RepID=A0A4Z0J5R2_9LACO|nr:DNA internalization-related competence protein ComEC/Rec2 [Levilactobacillus suantsaiihabitans]TGD17837.1 DNA internalization-related competence protein ComEC/Rec2 [Levilactobacillus suantsaiihabitans]
MANHGFLAVLPVLALSVALSGHPWAGSGLLLLVLVRVWTLHHRPTWLVTLLLLGLFGGYWLWRDHQLTQRQLPFDVARTMTATLRVQPDAVAVRGAMYYFVGQNSQTGERLTVRGVAKSAAELQTLQHLTRPTLWQVSGQVQGILPATNFNQFDGAAYWRHRGIVNTLKLTSVTHRTAAPLRWWGWFSDWWHGWRAWLIHYCERLPGALRVYALGLLPGAKAAETMTELQGMQRLGLLHLFAISGMHVALLLTAVEWVCVHLRIQREHWEWGMLLGLPAYFILAGSGSGVLRACLMRGVQLTGKRCQRPISTLDAWSMALLIGVFVNPGLLFELGSQLSYGLSLGLILLREESRAWRQGGLTLLGLPSLLTGVFQWHSLTLLANWAVVPLFPVLILPLTLVGTVLHPWLPVISRGCAWALQQFDAGLAWFARLPGNVPFGKPAWWVAWLWLAGTWWLFTRPPQHRRKWLIGLLASYGLVYGAIHLPLSGEVTYFDVGQGDSILIREPFNRRVSLIDTGGRLGFRQPDWVPKTPPSYAALRTNINYLKSRGLDHVDDLYLTHHDADHIGDLLAFLQELHVKRLLVPAGMEAEPAWQQKLAGKLPPVVPIKTGQALPLLVRHPDHAAPAENENSLALQGTFGGLNFLFMGDLDQAGERKMLAADAQLRTDVLKLGHHGSKTASAPEFIAQLRPRWAIISAGRQNRYGHPNAETLATLREQNVPAVSTQTSGMIRYTYRGAQGYWQTKLKGAHES